MSSFAALINDSRIFCSDYSNCSFRLSVDLMVEFVFFFVFFTDSRSDERCK